MLNPVVLTASAPVVLLATTITTVLAPHACVNPRLPSVPVLRARASPMTQNAVALLAANDEQTNKKDTSF